MRRFFLTTCLLCLALVAACAGDREAEILFAEAARHQEAGEIDEAMARLRELAESHPDSPLAPVARRELQSLEDMLAAERRFPVEQAIDLVRRTTRAVEGFRAERDRWPSRLGELVPAWLDRIEPDPWGRPLRYEATGETYRIACLGADGVAGGTGADQDVVVENGEFVLLPKDSSS